MPRIVKLLPPDRADYTFGDMLYWHLFEYGTRPNGDPSRKIGHPWDGGDFSHLLGMDFRTLRYWVADQHLPDDVQIGLAAQVLFGTNPLFDDAKAELWLRLKQTRLRNISRRKVARRKAARAQRAAAAKPAEPVDDTPTDASDATDPVAETSTAASDATGSTPADQSRPALHRSGNASMDGDEPTEPVDDTPTAASDATGSTSANQHLPVLHPEDSASIDADAPDEDDMDATGSAPIDQNLPAVHGGDSASIDADAPDEDDVDAAYDAEKDTWYVPSSWKAEQRQNVGKLPEIPRVILWPKPKARHIRRASLLVAGMALLFGVGVWTFSTPKPSGKKDSAPGEETLENKNKREAEARAKAKAEADRIEAERKAKEAADRQKKDDDTRLAEEKRKAGEAQARARAEQRYQLDATKDAVEQRRMDDQANAQALNAKLKVWAQADGTLTPSERPLVQTQADGNDLCKQKLEGVSVPDFTLKCDTLIPFGAMLGNVPVSQTASSLADCAARCRKAVSPKCVAFSFDAGAHTGSASCYLSGSITTYNPATNWIAGTR